MRPVLAIPLLRGRGDHLAHQRQRAALLVVGEAVVHDVRDVVHLAAQDAERREVVEAPFLVKGGTDVEDDAGVLA